MFVVIVEYLDLKKAFNMFKRKSKHQSDFDYLMIPGSNLSRSVEGDPEDCVTKLI